LGLRNFSQKPYVPKWEQQEKIEETDVAYCIMHITDERKCRIFAVIIGRGNRSTGRKSAPMPLCSP
jgi:hypothetical protein